MFKKGDRVRNRDPVLFEEWGVGKVTRDQRPDDTCVPVVFPDNAFGHNEQVPVETHCLSLVETCDLPGTCTHGADMEETGSALAEQVGGSHYKDMAIQPIEFCHKNGLTACETVAIRYICRHRNKNGREDVEKAIHMLRLLLELEYKE